MNATSPPPAYAGHRGAVTALMQGDTPFGEVEDAIDSTDLSEDARAALWLLAFSMRDRQYRRGVRAKVPSIG